VSETAGAKPEIHAPDSPGDAHRLIVVAAEAAVGDELVAELERHLGEGDNEILLVAPALASSPLKHALGDVDEGIGEADERLRRSLEVLDGRRGLRVRGEVGDADPLIAIEDALLEFPADEIVIVTHPGDEARWLEGDLFDRARKRVELPLTHIVLTGSGDGAHVADVERAGAGTDDTEQRERRGFSRNMPPMTWQDIGGIVVAIVGTIVLIVLAANCSGSVGGAASDVGGDDNGCVVRYILAGIAALVNMAHVVGLVLFESVRYRGLWQRAFAKLSLLGTPAAIVASLLVH
jgi:hypothetical protein